MVHGPLVTMHLTPSPLRTKLSSYDSQELREFQERVRREWLECLERDEDIADAEATAALGPQALEVDIDGETHVWNPVARRYEGVGDYQEYDPRQDPDRAYDQAKEARSRGAWCDL